MQDGSGPHRPGIFLGNMPSVALGLSQNQCWSVFWYVYQIPFLRGTWQGQFDRKLLDMFFLQMFCLLDEYFENTPYLYP